jgi:hypothetical protein
MKPLILEALDMGHSEVVLVVERSNPSIGQSNWSNWPVELDLQEL